MNHNTIPDRIAVRLSKSDRDAIAAVAAGITSPHRSPPTVSETLRAAVTIAASTMTASGLPQ